MALINDVDYEIMLWCNMDEIRVCVWPFCRKEAAIRMRPVFRPSIPPECVCEHHFLFEVTNWWEMQALNSSELFP